MELKRASERAPGEYLRAAFYAAVLLWVNLYIARDFFTAHTAHMNSMHGFWIAMAKRAGSGWFRPSWWPYWDCGIPFEAAYAPLVPALTAAWAVLGSIPHSQAFSCVTGFFYCLAPMTLFLMAWLLTRAPGASFFAALFYSLTSATLLIVPDGDFHLDRIWEARRLYLVSVWDDTPHMAALSLLPLAILFLVFAIERRRVIWCAAASATIAVMTMASAFGPVISAMAAACLLFVFRRESWVRNTLLVAGIGTYAYLMAMAFVPPSVLRAINESAAASGIEKWTLGSLTALAVVILGWTVLWHFLPRWTGDWRLHFFSLFAWIAFCVPATDAFLHRRLMPQPGRYKMETELAVALLVVFLARPIYQKLPVAVRCASVFLLLALAVEQVAAYRKFEKQYVFPVDATQTVEYRAATWVHQNLAGTRVFLPGSLAQWADDFAPVLQFTGGSWSMATNQSQQKANVDIVYNGDPGARGTALLWLKAFGVGAVGVAAPGSPADWKPFGDPAKFSALPVLWSDSGITIHRVPLRSASLAHVVPPGAIVNRPPQNPEDDGVAVKYVAALDDAALPLADLEWLDPNHIRIRATAWPGQAVSIQVGYHPGWHANANGQHRAIYKDGLGLMWLRPECNGACAIDLDYDGGWQLWLCRLVSYLAMLLLAVAAIYAGWGRLRPAEGTEGKS